MKNVVMMVVFLVCFGCNAQPVKFKLYRQLPCSNTEMLDSSGYYLMALNGKTYKPSGIIGGVTILPGIGEYFVYISASPLYELRPASLVKRVEINDTTDFTFKYREEKLTDRIVGTDGYNLYYMCNNVAEGYQQDFYPNGKLRVRGNFKNGKPKDSLVFFYENGNAERRVDYQKHHVIVRLYDRSARLIKISYNSTKSYVLTNYRSAEYFGDGRIKIKESIINRIKRINDYYPNGNLRIKQTKHFRYENYENGTVQTLYRWKRKRDRITDSKDWHTFIILKKKYDETAHLIESDAYEYWGNIQHQPEINIDNCSWIDSIIKFKDGKEVFRIEEVDTKEYFKK